MKIITQEKKSQKNQDFTLENNVLKGPETSIDLICSNIGDLLLDSLSKNPDHISQINATTGDTTTHAEMKNRSIRCALWMEKQGLAEDDVVALFTHNQLDAYVPVFATYFVQATINPWLCDLTSDEVQRRLELLRPKLIFVRTESIEVIERAIVSAKLSTKIVVLGEHPRYPSLNEIIQSQSSSHVEKYRPANRKNPREVAIIVATSGTTGQSKHVMISAEALLTSALDPKLQLRGKSVLWYGPPDGVTGNSMMLACVFQSARRIISNSTEPREVCRVIGTYEVNYAQMGPAILNLLAHFQEIDTYDLDSLEVVRTSGTKLNRVTFHKLKSSCLRDKIYQGYGSSEIGAKRIDLIFGRSLKSHNSIGFASSNLQLRIIDRLTKKTLGANELGEMLIKSPTMMLGYYKNPEATSKALDPEGWYHTGDVGYYDENGEIYIMGRITDAFEYCGQEIFTTEIEDILWEHPAVLNLAVVPVPRELVGQVPVAFVVIRPGKNVTENEMIGLLKSTEKYKGLPLKVQFIDTIPLTCSLKAAKTYLIESALNLLNGHN